MNDYDAFVLTSLGKREIGKCSREKTLSYSLQQHQECWNKSFYKSIKQNIVFSELEFKILNFFHNGETIDKIWANTETDEICRGCKRSFSKNKIMRHISHSKKCKSAYGPDYENLRMKKSKDKRKLYDMKNKSKISQQKAKFYQEYAEQTKLATRKCSHKQILHDHARNAWGLAQPK